jgi:hypothetical protein
MAYDFEYLSHVGGTAPSPRFYSYNTEDPRGTVLGVGYFNSEYLKFKVKDIIIINNGDEAYTVRVTAVSINSVTVIKTSLLDREYTFHYLPTPTTYTLNDDGVTYTQVTGMTIITSREFNMSGNNLVYTGVGGKFLFNGAADMSSNKNADIETTLFVNDVASSQSITRSFTSANKRGSTADTGIFDLATNDVIKVMMKGDGTTGTQPHIYAMNLTFLEV